MRVSESLPGQKLVRLGTLAEAFEDKTFRLDKYNYAVVKICPHSQGQPKHIHIGLEGGVLCFNLCSQTLRVLSWETQVIPLETTVNIRIAENQIL